MSPRFRRYLIRALPALLIILAINWLLDHLFGGDFNPGLGFGVWFAILMSKWAIRTEPDRRE
ncbi:hypothetical protein [Deinococcus arenicola]|uniref:Uncharacterized protein n=1 Tax=Deinococcus arenicola TaxID=2994950 RepID=A0ABU4DQP1_9DEIO|nr:hypothetical protein [Deinococcus sp. ZS9-10]MDV6374751.1 hypothetical protein [Deinococcus sp. ZS9-10]